ncbi:MAG: phosphatidate cytidylyltransferase [Coriobacteriia bacterium]|nr:phosphatidate cytidylyltransferase [Coriobacteriia bacterium]
MKEKTGDVADRLKSVHIPENIKPVQAQPAGIKKASLIQRIITGAGFVVVMLGAIVAGNWLMLLPLLMALFAVLGTREFFRMVAPDMARVPYVLGQVIAAAMPLTIAFTGRFYVDLIPVLGTGGLRPLISLFYVSLLGLAAYIIWAAVTRDSRARDLCASLFGALYLGIPLSCLLLIRNMGEQGLLLAVALVFSIWASDSFAYLGGSLFGRNKLAPVISPKKSWEGLIAGTMGAMVFWYVIPLIFLGSASIPAALIVGLIVSLASLFGDLFESRIKREAGVKDSGTLLPGHGGILDRIDSLLLTAPLLFVLFSTVGVFLGIITP